MGSDRTQLIGVHLGSLNLTRWDKWLNKHVFLPSDFNNLLKRILMYDHIRCKPACSDIQFHSNRGDDIMISAHV